MEGPVSPTQHGHEPSRQRPCVVISERLAPPPAAIESGQDKERRRTEQDRDRGGARTTREEDVRSCRSSRRHSLPALEAAPGHDRIHATRNHDQEAYISVTAGRNAGAASWRHSLTGSGMSNVHNHVAVDAHTDSRRELMSTFMRDCSTANLDDGHSTPLCAVPARGVQDLVTRTFYSEASDM